MVDKPARLNETSWYSSAWLIGKAALALNEHPLPLFTLPVGLPKGTTFTLAPLESLQDSGGYPLFRQRVDICCCAKPADLKELTEPPLNVLADLLAFHTLRPVAVQHGPFTTAPPGVTEGPHRSISFCFPRQETYQAPVTIHANIPATTSMVLASHNADQNERLLRSMSWLRRSFLSTDPFLEFSALAFGLEAIAALLTDSARDSSTTSERLRMFALTVPQITERRWKQVGNLRHKLFHGGITETSKSSQLVLRTSPIARLALIAALRATLKLPEGEAPELPRLNDGYVSDQRLEVNDIWLGQPPDAI